MRVFCFFTVPPFHHRIPQCR